MSTPARPNILFVLTDDLGYWALGAYGNSECETPNLDRLAQEGMRFDNFFCVSPVCSPARASLLTGRIPSAHGVHDWLRAGNCKDASVEPDGQGEVIEYLAGMTGYTDVLAKNGYTCGLSGKWHLGDAHTPQKGFTYWKAHAKGGSTYYNAPMIDGDKVVTEPRYISDVFTDNAIEFLDEQATRDEPFYLSVHYTAPHSPWDRDNHPSELWDRYHDDCAFNSAPTNEERAAWIEHVGIPVDDEATRRSYLAGYYTAITAMDANVGRLLDRLDEHGLRENTLVIFTSDNGMNMGHHGVYGKGNATFPLNMYEESVKVPLLMSWPAAMQAGTVNDDLLSHYDVMPTLIELAGGECPKDEPLPGGSFAPLLRDEPCDPRERVVVFDEYGPVRMIRDRDWKYVHRYPYGPHELYHLADDPGETQNLIDDEGSQPKAHELRHALEAWFHRYVDPTMDGLREDVSGIGQLGRVGIHAPPGVRHVPLASARPMKRRGP